MSARIEAVAAFVLRGLPYRETSLLLEVFSVDHGRLGIVARGARAPHSRLRGLLQPFCALLIGWRESGELASLSSAEAAGPPLALSGEQVLYGWYLNELLLRLLPRRDPHPELFAVYADTLPRLTGAGAQAALRGFEYRLLGALGYALPLPEPIEPARRYRIDPQRGAAPAAADDLHAIAGSTLIALRDGALNDPAALQEARRLLAGALATLLGGRELETPKLLRSLRAGFADRAR
ncbi:MAG: DNA repair protein RecO [Gammaproteobacteria bacterium]|nr:DNA repair protein RecO [Gammaproteobacteria bacterium]